MQEIHPRIKIPKDIPKERIKEASAKALARAKKTPSLIKRLILDFGLLVFGMGILFVALFMMWVSSLELPTFSDFEARKIANSTKIYDRTGKILLYNIHDNIKRTVVDFDDISQPIKDAVISIEDDQFYHHMGIRPKAIIRSVFKTATGNTQGGSTITQQIIKNSLLSTEQTVTRKVKEWILAVKLEDHLSKDEILNIYLNESPFGGNIYGVEEAAQTYFGKPASQVTIVEAAYLAALPQAPSRYSPYGKNRQLLEDRKNLVLSKMREFNYITETQYKEARNTTIQFEPQEKQNGKALHFVFYVRGLLEEQFGEDEVENGGLHVITSLDWELQQKAEAVVKEYATLNKEKYDAENAGLVAIDPRTGQVLAMVGSKDYFDADIDGKVNITLAKRQPGSSFKPIVYAAAFNKGYTPDTVLMDVPTEFNANCPVAVSENSPDNCYSPVNYDGVFRGPVNLRNALAQSLNVPAVKLLYLTGVNTALDLARQMGITTLKDKNQYGLTLVLGGGEVTLLELTGAYTTFANNGDRSNISPILEVKDKQNQIKYSYKNISKNVLPKEVVLTLSNVLSDNNARIPAFGATSPLYFGDRPVAVKTGTTNDYRDVWTVGYTPSITVGVWGGNNDNTPINKKSAGSVISPMWHAFMAEYFKLHPEIEYFETPPPIDETINPILRGIWCSETSGIHSILYYINKNNPKEFTPGQTNDPQFPLWEGAINLHSGNISCPFTNNELSGFGTEIQNSIDTQNIQDAATLHNTSTNNISTENPNIPTVIDFRMSGVDSSTVYSSNTYINPSIVSNTPILRVEYSINGKYIGAVYSSPYNLGFMPSEYGIGAGNHTLTARVFTSQGYSDRSITLVIK